MSGDTFEFDQGDRETLRGTLHDPTATTGHVLTVQADKSIAAAPGGGAAVQCFYVGNAVTIADGASANLTWDTLAGGTDLLDRSALATPTFLTDGFYAICATVNVATPLTPGGYAAVIISGPDVNANGTSQNLDAFATGAALTVVQICHYSAGDSPSVGVANADGAAPRDYTLTTALIVKLA